MASGGGGGFIGFSAFAAPSAANAASAPTSAGLAAAAKPAKASSGNNGPTPLPVFTGSDVNLHQLFRRIGQKRDGTTRVRALAELSAYAFSADASTTASSTANSATNAANTANTKGSAVSRPDKIAALSHLTYLCTTKLLWDNHPPVRAAALTALLSARKSVPKAWRGLVLYGAPMVEFDEGENKDGSVEEKRDGRGKGSVTVEAAEVVSILPQLPYGNIASIAHLLQSDPSSEVSSASRELVAAIQEDCCGGGGSSNGDNEKAAAIVDASVLNFAVSILSLGNPEALDGAVFGSSSGRDSNDIGVGGNGKGNKKARQKQQGAASSQGGAKTEAEREEREERYERTILSALGSMSLLVRQRSEAESPNSSSEGGKEWTYAQLLVTATGTGNASALAAAAPVWRSLTSSRSSFRRATYGMLSELAQRAPSLLHPPAGDTGDIGGGGSAGKTTKAAKRLSTLIPTVLTNERDPTNVAAMLNFVLSYVASFPRGTAWSDATSGDQTNDGIDAAKTVSALAKLFRRGCHGAPALEWSPIVLPLVACLPRPTANGDNSNNNAAQIKILAALGEGRAVAVGGIGNEAAIVTAVVETGTFLLLRRLDGKVGGEEPIVNESMEIARFILDGLDYYLTQSEDARRDSSASSLDGLCDALNRDLQRIDAANDRTDCLLCSIRDWFWSDDGVRGVIAKSSVSELAVFRLGKLVRLGASASGKKDPESESIGRLTPILRECVSKDWSGIASPSREVAPTEPQINLLLVVMKFCGVTYVLNSNGEDPAASGAPVESYISRTLVPWIISLFSSASFSESALSSRGAYVEILSLCLASIPSTGDRRKVWASALKDMVDAHVDLSFLAMAISEVASVGDEGTVCCEALDEFASQLGDAASMLFRTGALGDGGVSQHVAGESRSMRPLLETFVGLRKNSSGKSPDVLIGDSAIKSWVESTCQESEEDLVLEDGAGNNVLLDILLDVTSQDKVRLSYEDLRRVALQSWKEGGRIWSSRCLIIPSSHQDSPRLMNDLGDDAQDALKRDLGRISSSIVTTNSDRMCRIWSARCKRLFNLSHTSSLAAVGIDHAELWSSSYLSKPSSNNVPNLLYSCLKHLLLNFDDPLRRRELLCGDVHNIDSSRIQLFAHILLSLSSITPSIVPYANSIRQSQCFDLFALIGAEDLPRDYLRSLCKHITKILAKETQECASSDADSTSSLFVRRLVVVLGVIAEKLFPRRQAVLETAIKANDDVAPADVNEGDNLYYITKDENATRVACQVVKVHTDDYPNLYFSIRIEADGKVTETERQTVASRLKRQVAPPSVMTTNEQEIEEGSEMSSILLDRIIKPNLSKEKMMQSPFIAEAAAECCSIAVSRFGLGSKSGLGTVRYDMFQVISGLERATSEDLASGSDSFERSSVSLNCLALAFGFGKYVEASPENAALLNVNPAGLIAAVKGAVDRNASAGPLGIAALAWLSVALTSTEEGEVFRDAMAIFECVLSGSVLSNSDEDFALALRSFGTVQKQAHACIDYSSADTKAERQSMSAFVRGFAAVPIDSSAPTPLWLQKFTALLQYNLSQNEGGSRALLSGVRQWNETLCDSLFCPAKRWCGHQLLTYIATEQREINPSGQIPDATRRRLKLWKSKLFSEEAEELQDDATGASKWLPEIIMDVVEGFAEMSDEDRNDHDEDEIVGKLLNWLVCLSFLDNAAAVDIRNRSAITSYLDKSAAVGEILIIANRYANLNNKSMAWMSCLDNNEAISLSDISTLAVFRTVESVPTLAKKWFMDYCPRSLQAPTNDFVQKRVAPETLKRELSRISNVKTTFGEMNVSGSSVSREVTATYVQDECTLSVLIKIPPSFPLRNAEVDCKKTLGIPEKRWRRWGLQITRMLNHEDGSILDALLLWKQNVDKEFEGVEPCPVCYSVLCVKTHTMPNLECKTCENRFHSSCLMKWFQSSGKSQCVLCQQPWSGSKTTA